MSNNVVKQNVFLSLVVKVLNKFYILLIAVVIGVGAGLSYFYFLDKPTYTATRTVMLVMNMSDSGETSSNDATLSKIYLDEVVRLIKSPIFVNEANKIYKAKTNAEDGVNAGSIGVSFNSKSLIFKISYTASSTTNLKEKIDSIIESANTKTTSAEGSSESSLLGKYIVAINPSLLPMYDSKEMPSISTNKGLARDCFVGGLVGAIAGIALIYLIYVLDNTIKDKEEFEEITGAICLAHIEDAELHK